MRPAIRILEYVPDHLHRHRWQYRRGWKDLARFSRHSRRTWPHHPGARAAPSRPSGIAGAHWKQSPVVPPSSAMPPSCFASRPRRRKSFAWHRTGDSRAEQLCMPPCATWVWPLQMCRSCWILECIRHRWRVSPPSAPTSTSTCRTMPREFASGFADVTIVPAHFRRGCRRDRRSHRRAANDAPRRQTESLV